jgi:hypothetical protein
MSPTRSGYRELGLDLVSLEEKCSHPPKKPPMVEEKRENRFGYPTKLFIEESFT